MPLRAVFESNYLNFFRIIGFTLFGIALAVGIFGLA
jgi:hypothetical protein